MANNYQSELTKYINEYKTKNPDTEANQRAGRARLWDKELDNEQQEGFRKSKVAQDPYVYYQKA